MSDVPPAREIAAAGVPVITTALTNLPETFESLAATQSNVGRLRAAGVTVALRTTRNTAQEAGNLVGLAQVPGATGLDWYTSATCSDVRWIKTVVRCLDPKIRPNMSTDISSVLGSIFIGNMSMMTFSNSLPHRSATVIASTDFDTETDTLLC